MNDKLNDDWTDGRMNESDWTDDRIKESDWTDVTERARARVCALCVFGGLKRRSSVWCWGVMENDERFTLALAFYDARR